MSFTLERVIAVSKKEKIHQLAQRVSQEVFVADDPNEAVDITRNVNPSLIFFDAEFSHETFYRFLSTTDNIINVPVIVVTDSPACSESDGKDFIKAGALEYFHVSEDIRKIEQALSRFQVKKPDAAADSQNNKFFIDDYAASISIVGQSKAIINQLKMTKLVAKSSCNPVLIVGETGTGKELAARAVHFLRAPKEPFIALNCAALTANLLESELFGHTKGSFTGADRDKVGLLELAGFGTIFLDEISEMPLELQAKLLRVVQEKEFRKVGGIHTIRCNASIIASSNRDLKKELQLNRFRSDLYYRLSICPIIIEPVRSPDRKQDIPLLAEYFIKTSEFCPEKKNLITGITDMALEALEQYDWPGNVRQLKNVIERAILLETADKIGLNSIVIDDFRIGQASQQPLLKISDFSLEKAERQLITKALQQTGWQKTQTAALLGISRATLYAKLEQYKLKKNLSDSTSTQEPVSESPLLVST